MYIVVGLGNPGAEYEYTRHNTGRLAADFVADNLSSSMGGIKVLTPDTYMNLSGKFVAKHVKSKKAAEKLIVIYDDLDLALGSMKISYNRSSGGHKGVESIINTLKTREFIRIRIGIGKKGDVEKYILGKFTKTELEKLQNVFKTVSTAIEMIVDKGLPAAMSQYNQNP